MSPADFADWLKLMKDTRRWSKARCLEELGAGPNQARRWIDPKGKGPSQTVALACSAICQGLPPWTAPKRS